jgi:hypothetical protein
MATRTRIDPARLSTVLTSCGRFDLLEQTVGSFLEHFATDKILIAEDSGKAEEAAAFARAFPVAEMLINEPKLGQMRSIDVLYARLSTPYVLHLEDDWAFSASADLDRIMDFMEGRPDVSVVSIGYRLDQRYLNHAKRCSHGGLDYLIWDLEAHPKWFSYSFNPSIGRVTLWREIGPFARFMTEENVSEHCKARGMRLAMALPSIARHIGDERHAHDPFQPKRAMTPLARLKRSFAKRWARLQGGRTR